MTADAHLPTRDRVLAILAEQALLDPSDLSDDMTLADLGIDSLGTVETVYAIEETFDLTVPYNANDPQAGGLDLSTVGSIVRAVEGLVARRP